MDYKHIYKICGLPLFYRDTILSENLISKYVMEHIQTERSFIQYKGGRLTTILGYLIASENTKDSSVFNSVSGIFLANTK